MKNLFKTRIASLLGIIAIVAVIGFTMAACEEEAKDELDGTTWKASRTEDGETMTVTLKFESPNFTMTMSGGGESMTQSGTYSISGSTVTFTMTEDGETMTEKGTLSGKTLTIDDWMVFTKQ